MHKKKINHCFKDFKDIHKGETIYIIGNGPSLSATDLNLIKNSPSKIFSSPTKVGESLGCGVPVIYNKGIGDLDEDMKNMKVGYELSQSDFMDEHNIKNIVLSDKSKLQIRENSINKYGLENAVKKFVEIYKSI